MTEQQLTVGVDTESDPGERRVAIVPESVPRLRDSGLRVRVAAGAGAGANFTDADYTAAGAEVVPAATLADTCDILVTVGRPPDERLHALRDGQVVVGQLAPRERPEVFDAVAETGATAVSLDQVPRTVSRAQPMDVLSSQASVAGYKAALVAADAYDRYFPLLMTAAGVAKPARVLVLGAGVAGLQAIATARRLGAQVTGYDVRPQAREEIVSLGAGVLELPTVDADAAGGYARALTDDEQGAQRAALAERVGSFDIVITTAQVFGARPPLLVDAAALQRLRPGAVVVDLAAGPYGGNVEGSVPNSHRTTDGGVVLVGAGNLPARVPRAASEFYARNVSAALHHLTPDGALRIDLDDEITAAIVLTHGGKIIHPTLTAAAGTPVTAEGSAR